MKLAEAGAGVSSATILQQPWLDAVVPLTPAAHVSFDKRTPQTSVSSLTPHVYDRRAC